MKTYTVYYGNEHKEIHGIWDSEQAVAIAQEHDGYVLENTWIIDRSTQVADFTKENHNAA